MIRLPTVRSVWKVLFAITALIELQYIILLMRRVDDTKHDSDEYCQSTLVYVEDNKFSINYTFIDRAWESTITISQLVFVWTGPIFCALCIIEALVRAVEARRAALHNRALDDFERSVLRMAQQSSVRLSMFFRGSTHDQGHMTKNNISTVSKVMRSWFPPVATIAFWLFILPTDVADFHHRCGSDRLHDSAVVTQWMKSLSLYISNLVVTFHTFVESIFWTKILPYRIHQPKRFIQRLQVILRWIRFARFAGPLFRMGLKLQDQMRAFWRARRQSQNSKLEKQRRIDRPSMIFTDIQNLLQLAKAQTALARVPSFRGLQSSPRLSKLSSSVMETYNKRREFGKKITEQLKQLQKDYLNFGDNDPSHLYDRIRRMSQDITASMNSEKRNYSHRYVKSLRSLLSSRQYLISPRTRFSLAWRLTVTNCLLLEVARLCASWKLSKSFSIPLSQIVGRLLVDCKAPEQVKNHVTFFTDQINSFRRHLFDILPILGEPPLVDIKVCVPNGPQALLILHFGKMIEYFVDTIVFIDIFVWFLTGDIDAVTHTLVPKPFFTRCILPGTLVQVLDHPTLPDLLPSLLKSILATFATIGYSRCIRWGLAIIPCLKMIVLDPLTDYFFRHIEKREGLMAAAESLGMLTPERKSDGIMGSAGSLGGSKRHFFRQDSDARNTSQVGLSFDSPVPSRYDIQSMLSTEGSVTDDSLDHIPSSLLPPSLLSGMPMQNSSSPFKKEKSVHFGLSENNEGDSRREEISNVGYSLSSTELHDD